MSRYKTFFWILGALVLACTSCGGNDDPDPTVSSDTQPPLVQINQPLGQAFIQAGQAVAVEIIANDDVSVARIELYVDNSLVESRVAPTDSVLTAWRETFTWSASIIGPHTLQARAYDAVGLVGASASVAVTVSLDGQPPSAPTPVPPQATPTSVPSGPTETSPAEAPLVTALTNANVRGGPGTNYNVVGGLAEAESARVTGRNADSTWWQIEFQGGTAWIANVVVTANAPAHDAPVASAPPPPPTNTPVPATAAPTAAPTGTPAATTGLRTDHTTLIAGECTTLRWDFGGIKAVYVIFGMGYSEEGVGGHGSRQVCPSVTTTYQARLVNNDDSTSTHESTVNVSGSACADPVIERFDPTAFDVSVDEPFSIFWDVSCAQNVWFIVGDEEQELVDNSGKRISLRVTANTVFRLKVEKSANDFVYASFTVKIK